MDAMHLDQSGARDAKIPPEAGFGFCFFIFDRFGLGLDFCYLLWFLLVDFLRFCFISATHAPCVSWEKRLSETFCLLFTFFISFLFSFHLVLSTIDFYVWLASLLHAIGPTCFPRIIPTTEM